MMVHCRNARRCRLSIRASCRRPDGHRPALARIARAAALSAHRAGCAFSSRAITVDLAKRYRRYAMDTGLFVSLAEKIARRPVVKELIGTPQTRLGILTNIKSDSLKYNKTDPNANHRMTTFDDRAKQLEQMKAAGLERLGRGTHWLATRRLRSPASRRIASGAGSRRRGRNETTGR